MVAKKLLNGLNKQNGLNKPVFDIDFCYYFNKYGLIYAIFSIKNAQNSILYYSMSIV